MKDGVLEVHAWLEIRYDIFAKLMRELSEHSRALLYQHKGYFPGSIPGVLDMVGWLSGKRSGLKTTNNTPSNLEYRKKEHCGYHRSH